MNVYISGLAAVDLFICALSSYRLYFWIEENDFHNQTVCHLFTWLGFWSEMLTAFLTTAIALDRYLSVCRPHSGIITPVRAMVSIAIFTVASGLLSLFSFIIYNIDEEAHTCKISTDNTALLYTFATLTFSAFGLLMILALIFYWFVFREVRRRTKVQPRLIKIQPRFTNSSSVRPEPTAQRSQSVPCSPTQETFTGGNRWKQTQRLMIARQLDQRLTLVSLATAFSLGQSQDAPQINVETVSIRQRSLLTTDISHLALPFRSGSATQQEHEAEGRSRSSSSFNHIGSQFDAGTTVAFNVLHESRSRASSCINHTLSQIDIKAASNDANKHDVNNQPALRRRRTGKMLLLATIVFVVTWTARCIMWLVEITAEDWWDEVKHTNEAGFAALILLQHIYYTTPAVNPVIYSYVNPRFREDCEKILKHFKCRCNNDL